jgi:UDP-N-acetylmuramyl pentapeptide phosphotransferase/UDP-N-acetylglucosamine-1-phosphate transferase
MATALSMAAAAFLLTLSLGYPVLSVLRRAGIAKQVRADELPSHFSKTGTLALGATLAVVSLMLGQVLLLPIIAFIFVAVTLSVILQVGYFRLTSGKRLLRRAPLHRHFELMGWSQMQVAQRFWLISMVTGVLGVALALK